MQEDYGKKMMRHAPYNAYTHTPPKRPIVCVMPNQRAALIGRRLRDRREELGWTRRDLTRRLDGVATESDLYRWETGRHRPREDTLAAIAKALGRDYLWALGPDGLGQADDLTSRIAQLEQAVAALASKLEAPSGEGIYAAWAHLALKRMAEMQAEPESAEATDRQAG